jgi:hypothetical protein
VGPPTPPLADDNATSPFAEDEAAPDVDSQGAQPALAPSELAAGATSIARGAPASEGGASAAGASCDKLLSSSWEIPFISRADPTDDAAPTGSGRSDAFEPKGSMGGPLEQRLSMEDAPPPESPPGHQRGSERVASGACVGGPRDVDKGTQLA